MLSPKKILENSFWYSLSSILLRGTSIIFFPIFSSYLSQSDYGILSIAQSIVFFVSILANLELSRSITRFVVNHRNAGIDANQLISSAVITSLLSSTLVVGLLLLNGNILFSKVLSDIPFSPFIFWSLLSIPLNSLIDIYRVYLKATQAGKKAFMLDMGFFICNIILNLVLVVGFRFQALGIIISTLLSSIAFATIAWITFFRKIRFDFSAVSVQLILKYSLPLIPFAVLNALIDTTDKIFLNAKHGSYSSGVYYIAITFASIFSTIKESVSSALTPWIFSGLSSNKVLYIRKIIFSVFLSIGVVAIAISWFAKEILSILSSNPELVVASKYIPFLIVSLYIIFLGQLYNIKTFYYSKYSKYLFFSTLTGIIVNVICCYMLINIVDLGIVGALVSRMASFLALVIVSIFLSRLERENNEIYDTPKLTFTAVLISLLSLLPFTHIIFELLLLKVLLFSGIVLSTFFFLNKSFKLSQSFMDATRSLKSYWK